MDIQVSPRRANTVSVSDAVAEAHRIIEASGLQHMLHPMGTCVEGEATQLYELASTIHQALATMGYDRIGVLVKIDDRRDKPATMSSKLEAVQAKLHRY